MKIFFDMDGTIADLYSVENWLPRLRSSDPTPYTEAKPMLHFSTLARYLNKLQKAGIEISIISWTSKGGSATYNQMVEDAKKEWLRKHLPSVRFNHIYIVPYGYPKELFGGADCILFDDCENIRNDWHGKAYSPDRIMEILKAL